MRMRPRARYVCLLVFALGMTLGALAAPGAHAATLATAVPWAPTAPPPLLPGEALWGGVPSYDFGTNETQEWDSQYTLETEPAIQRELKAAHFTLLRTWFLQNDLADGHAVSDAEQLARVQALRNAGMTCLGELPTANSLAYDEHVVSLLKGQCELYEFMNEPDDENVSVSTYVSQWSSEIPKLRAIDPNARFGGPAAAAPSYSDCTYYADGTQECYLQKVLKGMEQSGVLPDFVTFHYYPCWQMDAATCQAQASTFGEQVSLVRGWVRQYFGAAGARIPVGVTEWNADPSAPMPSYTQNASWMISFTTTAEEGMVRAGASFITQFDLASDAGYGSDDMVDIYHNGTPRPQWTALAKLIQQVYPGAPPAAPPPAPIPTPTPTLRPHPAPTPRPPAAPHHTPTAGTASVPAATPSPRPARVVGTTASASGIGGLCWALGVSAGGAGAAYLILRRRTMR